MMQRYVLIFILFFLPFLANAQTIEYVRNDGQWNGSFNYKGTTPNGDIFLAENSFMFLVGDPANSDLMEKVHHGRTNEPAKLNFHAYKLTFEGAGKPRISASKEQSWYYNYFHGNDPAKWKSGIHPAMSVDYAGLYNGIDMHVSSEKNHIKYEFIVAPGADPAQIKVKYDGVDGLRLEKGNLMIKTSIGTAQELKPYVYQYFESGRKTVPCRYKLTGNTITYDLYNDYDATKPLIIDPNVVFATFSGSTADNWGYTATYDPAGNFYGGGAVLFYAGSPGGTFPVSTGAFQATFGGGINDPANNIGDTTGLGIACDVAVMKLNPTGTTKIYATYIGGANNEVPHSMIVDANNNLIIGGKTHSNNFPTTTGAYDASYNGNGDIFITKLNATGTGLVGSTYLGGSGKDGTNFSGSEYVYGNLKYNYGDDARSEVLVDNAGNVYLAGCSYSTNFPTTAGASQPSNGGGQDGVIVKLNSNLSNLIWSTYLGGSNDDAGYVMALDQSQSKLYVGGGTMSTNFPTTGGTYNPGYQGGASDGYIARYLNSAPYTLEKVSFIGTSNLDQVYGVQVDLDNNVYAMGQSLGGTFPVSPPTVYSRPNSSQFVIKLNTDLSTRMYSTVFGNGDPTHTNISPVAFLVDTCQNVYISGWGGNLNLGAAAPTMPTTIGNTIGMDTTANAYQTTTDGSDFYFIVLSKNAQSLLYATFYGRNTPNAGFGEHVDGGTSRFDRQGVVYQAICGGCGGAAGPALPTTPGTHSPINASTNCNLAMLKIAFNLGAVEAQANATPIARGCPPLVVQFQNSSTNATSYYWDFKDGGPTSSAQTPPAHTFNVPGIYDVMLVAYNPNACKTHDTSYIRVTVDSTRIRPAFNAIVTDSCGPWRIAVSNASQYSATPGAAGFTTFTWLWGDGTQSTGVSPGSHNYSSAGTYNVRLVMRDTSACNSPDTVTKTIVFNDLQVKADFNVPDSLCQGAAITFSDNSTNATSWLWDFGDGTTATQTTVAHTYASAGTYTIKLISLNPNACNKRDSMMKTVTIFGVPTANFTFAPVIPVPNTPIDFTNTSTGATDYTWSFGDNTSSNLENPSHLYRKTGKYKVCLVAANKNGCADTVCKTVEADILTRVEVPTAFSPNGDGNNDVFYARGGGIEFLDMKIFNRWGQLIFERSGVPANDPVYGWNGTYNNKDQEMEAYAFVLNVTFIDGSTTQRKGNVTLVR